MPLPPDTTLIVDAALAGMALLVVGTFGVGVRVLLKVNELVTVVCTPKSGLVDRFEALSDAFDKLKERVDRALGEPD